MSRYLVVDIATAPIADAGQFHEPVSAPANYKDPEKIAAYVREKEAEQADRGALDMDLCRISGIGWQRVDGRQDSPAVWLFKDEESERHGIELFADAMAGETLVSFNGLRFDWPVLMRRALYLDVPFPAISLDRFKSNHIDLYAKLTNSGTLSGHSLRFYAARLGWLDLEKTLSGAEEAKVFSSGLWAELEASIRHDVTATVRLAKWAKVL